MLSKAESQIDNGNIPLIPHSWYQRFFHFFEFKILSTGYKKAYRPSLLFKIPEKFGFEKAFDAFYEYYQSNKSHYGYSFSKSLLLWLTPYWALQTLGFTIDQLVSLAYTLTLKNVTKALMQDQVKLSRIFHHALFFFMLSLVRAFIKIHSDGPLVRNINKFETAIYGIYFKKLETIDLQTIKRIDIGSIKSGLTSDLGRIWRSITTSHQVVSTPVLLLVSLVIIIKESGHRGLAGFFFFVVLSLAQILTIRKFFQLLSAKMILAEGRHKTVANIFNGIRTIKFNAWEDTMMDILDRARVQEKRLSRTIVFIRNALDGLFYILPLLSTLIFIWFLPSQKGAVDLDATLTIMGLLGLLTAPLRNLLFAIINFSEAMAALRRVAALVDLPDEPEHLSIEANDSELMVGELVVTSLTAAFEGEKPPPLKKSRRRFRRVDTPSSKITLLPPVVTNINLRISPGEFVGIIGKIGSGKTALLKSLLRMVVILDGTVSKNGKVAYISQESFLLHGTVRENITFGLEFDERRYRRVIRICELLTDLKSLPAGDETEVGERGVALSGGQKQRISIARALYSNSDIYLVDDCLSALDSHVGQSIFRNAFRGYLRGKTIILVTHALQFLKKLDRVIILDNGAIAAQGSYQQLLGNPRFDAFISEIAEQRIPTLADLEELRHHEFGSSILDLGGEASPSEGKGAVPDSATREEARFQGLVGWSVYRDMFASGGRMYFVFNIFLMIFTILLKIVADQWLSYYKSRQQTMHPMSRSVLIGGYASILLLLIGAIILRGSFYGGYTSRMSYYLFKSLMERVMHKRMSYFDTTPLGQLINLSSKDTDMLDIYIPMVIMFALLQSFQLLETLIQTSFLNLLALPIFTFFILIFLFILYTFLRAATELMRLQQIATSPVLSNIIEMYNGLALFRAYAKTGFQKQKYARNVDHLLSISLHDRYLGYYIVFVVDLLASLAVAVIIVLLGLQRRRGGPISAEEATRARIALNGIIRIPSLLSGVFFTLSEGARNMSSAERVMRNVDTSEAEPSWDSPPAPPGWPTEGRIEACNVMARYRSGLPLILRGIDFSIAAGEKIGIVGRTGCGKSSLLLALTRIISLESESDSSITIDGIFINDIGVRVLRRGIKVIPQDPFCFKGTLSENVDPQGIYSKEQIKEALQKSQFWEAQWAYDETAKAQAAGQDDTVTVTVENKNLEAPIEEGGKNLSAGEKQLICIARMILARPKILLMDEATSNIDHHTDLTIQKIIKKEFQHSTIISVAHRLNTIIQYDRLMVIDQGRVAEAGSPVDLLTSNSIFREIVRENGPEFEKKMLRLALNKDLEIEEEFPEEFTH